MTFCKKCGKDIIKWNYFERRWDCPNCGHHEKLNEKGNKKLDQYLQ